MLKNLLADRFGLKFHVDTKEGPVYFLAVDKGGLKMKADGSRTLGSVFRSSQRGPGEWTGTKVPLEYLCWFLGQMASEDVRPVIDQTGLKDVYDFELKVAPDVPAWCVLQTFCPPGVRNWPALTRRSWWSSLDFGWNPAKGPVPYYAIEHVEKPSAN